MVTAKIEGKDFNYFRKITVSGASFPTDADVVIPIRGRVSLTLNNEGSGVVEYSFNGTNLHGDMTPGEGSENLKFEDRQVAFIWLRLKSGAASSIRIEAWLHV